MKMPPPGRDAHPVRRRRRRPAAPAGAAAGAVARQAIPFGAMMLVAALILPAQPIAAAATDATSTGDRPADRATPGDRGGDFEATLDEAEARLEQGKHHAAVHLFRQLRSEHPDDARVLLGLARALTDARRFAEAEAIYRDMQKRGIEPIRAHLGAARMLEQIGKLQESERNYRNVLQATGHNLEARIGLARVKHRQGLNRAASEQADNIVLDHPESAEARALQREIRLSLRPHADLDPSRYDDGNNGRVDSATASYTFMAEPQTAIRIEVGDRKADFRCTDRSDCDDVAGTGPVDEVVEAEAQTLEAGLTSRLITPLEFHARLGAVRQESFDGGVRTVLTGGGIIGWRVGPRLEVNATGSRQALMDTARLIDLGIRLDAVDLRLDYRLRPSWLLSGHGGYGSYSDGNARQTAHVALRWDLPPEKVRVAGRFDAWYRTFNDDRDSGYFDPIRYDSERLTVKLETETANQVIFWSFAGMIGRQHYDIDSSSRVEAKRDEAIRSLRGAFGVNFRSRGRAEAFYLATDDPLEFATGFDGRQYGFSVRIRI